MTTQAKSFWRSSIHVPVLCTALALASLSNPAHADGTEFLGNPIGLDIARGSQIVAAGVGIRDGGVPDIDIEVPYGASIRQVLVYWEGLDWNPTDHGATASIKLNGVAVVGKNIGGPSDVFGSALSTTFRADVTCKRLVQPGENTVTVSDMDFTRFNNGAGLVVIYDTKNSHGKVLVKDGNDVASPFLGPPGDTTEPVTFTFEPSTQARTADVSMFFSIFFEDRASIVKFSVDGLPAESLIDEIDHDDGAAWDTVHHSVAIPAGAKTLTVQALAENSGVGRFLWNGPGKFIWMFCGLSLDAPKQGKGGCTANFWKHHTKLWDGVGRDDVTSCVRTCVRFNQVMGVNACQSWLFDCVRLSDALGLPGNHLWALNRQAAAALINANANIGYPYTTAQVISIYRDAVGAKSGPETIDSALQKFQDANELFNPFH